MNVHLYIKLKLEFKDLSQKLIQIKLFDNFYKNINYCLQVYQILKNFNGINYLHLLKQ